MGINQRPSRLVLLLLMGLVFAQLAVVVRLLRDPLPPPASLTAAPAVDAEAAVLVVRIRAATTSEVARLVALGLDLLELRDGSDLFAIVSPAQYNRLLADGWTVRIDAAQTDLLTGAQTQPFLGGYRTLAEIEASIQHLAQSYPALVTVQDYGDSWEKLNGQADDGHDLWALHITSPISTGTKPVFFLMAAIHPREIAVPEIALRFAEHLTAGYGSDADATWLLDAYRVVVVPMVNPDGYVFAEQQYSQRKNRNLTNGAGCVEPPSPFSQGGVDLNRNFSYRWGTIDSPDQWPCSLVYPGHEAASEPETQAIQNLLRELYPRSIYTPRPAMGTPAPDTTTGVIITLHSYSDLVLWPWGSSADPAPNAAGLERLGRRMAAFNGYTPSQSIGLYPTSGTTDDWSYAELGVPSYTFEIGPAYGTCGGFMPPIACMDEFEDYGGGFWQRNLPALLYALHVSAAPYTMPAGPHLAPAQVQVLTDTTTLTLTLQLAAGATLQQAEVYTGQAPWMGGVPVPLEPLPPQTPQLQQQQWQVVLPLDGVQAGCASGSSCLAAGGSLPILLLRGQDQAGIWGPLLALPAQATVRPQVYLPLVLRGV